MATMTMTMTMAMTMIMTMAMAMTMIMIMIMTILEAHHLLNASLFQMVKQHTLVLYLMVLPQVKYIRVLQNLFHC